MSIGNRVYQNFDRPDPDLVTRLAQCDPADINDAMAQAKTMVGIHPMFAAGRVAGPAVTVSAPVGGTSMLKVAMDLCQPGDVLVLAARGATQFAMFGGKLSIGLAKRGVVGLVIDGAVRDIADIERAGLPTFARAIASGVPADGLGEVNVPVACGGVVVMPGEIIVADANGIVAVPPAHAEEILAKASAVKAKLDSWDAALGRGEVPGIAGIIESVKARGCEFIAEAPRW
jgi:4-hydroxy-4-methyl-2-oxoglutarate aldolase